MYDTAIVGTGPAGFSAAVNLKLHQKNVIWFGEKELSQKVAKSEKIANYPGCRMISGKLLNQEMFAQAEELEIVITDKTVTSINQAKDCYMLLADNEIYQAKTVLLAIGVVAGKGIDREQELLGKGVSYCATCDGFLYRGKRLAVYCASPKYEHEVIALAGLAEELWLDTPYPDCGIQLPNVTKSEAPIKGILGEKQVEGIVLSNGHEIAVDGVFILRNAIAPAVLLRGLETDGAHIAVNRMQNTCFPGCFAAGDCTGRPYQIAKAVGEGNVAAHSILEYLAKNA